MSEGAGHRVHCALVTGPIDAAALQERVRTDGSGAVILFTGVVRDNRRGKRVERILYEAYGPMAEREMARIAEETRERWGLEGIAIVHRVGSLEVGEASVAVAVAAPHRRAAFEACAHALDRVKGSVPIWKKEQGEAGAGWVLGDDAPGSASSALGREGEPGPDSGPEGR